MTLVSVKTRAIVPNIDAADWYCYSPDSSDRSHLPQYGIRSCKVALNHMKSRAFSIHYLMSYRKLANISIPLASPSFPWPVPKLARSPKPAVIWASARSFCAQPAPRSPNLGPPFGRPIGGRAFCFWYKPDPHLVC